MATTGKAFISCSHRFVDNSFVFIINSRRAYNIGPLCDTKNSCEKFCSLVARYNQLPSPSDVQELVKLREMHERQKLSRVSTVTNKWAWRSQVES